MPDNELFNTALYRAMALCARREYCISEILTKIQSWRIDSGDCTKIIELLKKDNFINEERYALGFVKDKFNYNKWGKIKIASSLKVKDISDEIIKKALDTIDNNKYSKTLIDLISAHRRLVKAKNQYDLKAKLLRYGLSKGFESNLLYDLLNEMEE
jgi:regulatory protein